MEPRQCALGSVPGALAAGIAIAVVPACALALRDGYAVAAAAVADASAYAPVALAAAPARVDVGEPMPDGTDAVLPLDAIAIRGGRAEAIAGVAPGEGVLAAGEDSKPGPMLRRANEHLGDVDLAVLAACGISDLMMRAPRVHVACGSAARSVLIDAALAMLRRLLSKAGCTVSSESRSLEQALADDHADAVFAIGGTGSGRNDRSVDILARHGRVAAHGIATTPGETAAFGFTGKKPVLLMPGRLDAVLAAWIFIGRHVVARLAGTAVVPTAASMPLKRKVASAIGFTELIAVRCEGAVADPVASGYLSFAALMASDGWITVPASSEGFGAGAEVAVTPWP